MKNNFVHRGLVGWGWALLLVASPCCNPAWAGPGHDHGDAPAPAAGASVALPRFTAVSDAFELVGVLKGRQIVLYLDRAADNSPVFEATIELQVGAAKHNATKTTTGEFELSLAQAPKAGLLPITATVTVGQEVDLLAGELDIHDHSHAAEANHVHSRREYVAWGAGALALLAVLSLLAWRAMTSRALRKRGVA